MLNRVLNHNFFHELAIVNKNIVSLHDKKYSIFKNGFIPRRNLKMYEEYARICFLSGAEIATVCNQLEQSIYFMTNFRSTRKLKDNNINRYDHILYHLESHLIRITSCYDRCLILANNIYMLGNTDSNCKHNIIINNKYIKGSSVGCKLESIYNFIQPYRKKRNIVIHHAGYNHIDLRKIEGMSILEKQEEDIFLKYYFKKIIDNFIFDRKSELSEFNNNLFKLIDEFLLEVLVEFHLKYKSLKTI